jgi:hypothetical protein
MHDWALDITQAGLTGFGAVLPSRARQSSMGGVQLETVAATVSLPVRFLKTPSFPGRSHTTVNDTDNRCDVDELPQPRRTGRVGGSDRGQLHPPLLALSANSNPTCTSNTGCIQPSSAAAQYQTLPTYFPFDRHHRCESLANPDSSRLELASKQVSRRLLSLRRCASSRSPAQSPLARPSDTAF